MGTRAVIAVRDDTGAEHRFYSLHASYLFQVQHLAAFIHDTRTAGRILDTATYRNWVTNHPGTLPGEDITGRRWYRSPAQPGDLEHWYLLVLSAHRGSYRYAVLNRHHGTSHAGFTTTADITKDQQLYASAAEAAEQLARHTEHDTAARPAPIPGRPSPGQWREYAAAYRFWAAEAEERANTPNPALACRVTRLLHRHHPDTRIHTSSGTAPAPATPSASSTRLTPRRAAVPGRR
ncbi:MAG: hypothetical protein QOJ50_1903 [Cryptosporangiaceae bacterium]|nr:hypothetical protein [Cryptosporangiaceae bacterium]